jgi:hypothetical protein
MKRKTTDDIGVFNILLIGKSPSAISVADNIHAKFKDGDEVRNPCNFNIIGDIDSNVDDNTWFNEFIFEISTTTGKFNNIIVSEKFKSWMLYPLPYPQRLYMKKLLQAMNVVIVDVSLDDDASIFDKDIPQYKFNVEKDFGVDLFKWIDEQLDKIAPKLPSIRLIRSLSGKCMPYLGDVFGCLSGKSYKNILHTDKMRFDVPILFDEFCFRTRGKSIDEIENSILTRSSSAMASFFK